MIRTTEGSLSKGDKIAFMMKTRDGGRMFMFEGSVQKVDEIGARVETPTGIKDVETDDVVWSGKRWELHADDQREAPRKRGDMKRGR